MAENLDRRFGDVLVVVSRARLPESLQLPGFVSPVSIFFLVLMPARLRILGPDALQVGVNNAVHRPVKRLAGLHSSVKQPSPGDCSLALPSGNWRPQETCRHRIGSCSGATFPPVTGHGGNAWFGRPTFPFFLPMLLPTERVVPGERTTPSASEPGSAACRSWPTRASAWTHRQLHVSLGGSGDGAAAIRDLPLPPERPGAGQ